MSPELGQQVRLLVVEDDEVDFLVVKRALKKAQFGHPVHHAKDGVEALEMLRGGVDQLPLPGPVVMLLDYHLPRMSGVELLASLRGDPTLQSIPVFVLTTSDAAADKAAAWRHNVAGYLVKEGAADSMREVAQLLASYCRIVRFP